MSSFMGQRKILTVVLVFLAWVSTTLAPLPLVAGSFALSLCNLKFELITA